MTISRPRGRRITIAALALAVVGALLPIVPANAATQANFTITGIVKEKSTGAPMAGAIVSMKMPDVAERKATTNSSGRFTFTNVAPPANATVAQKGQSWGVTPPPGKQYGYESRLVVPAPSVGRTWDEVIEVSRLPFVTVGTWGDDMCVGDELLIYGGDFPPGLTYDLQIRTASGKQLLPSATRVKSGTEGFQKTTFNIDPKSSVYAPAGDYSVYTRRTGVETTWLKVSQAYHFSRCTASSLAYAYATGRMASGQTLTANTSGWVSGTTLSYQWKRDGANIAGATSKTYRLTSASVGKQITVAVTGRKSGYDTMTKVSDKVGKVGWAGKAWVTGTAKAGSRLKANVGSFLPGTTYTYRWLADGRVISGAKYSTFVANRSLIGKRISVSVTASKSGYATQYVTSPGTAPIRQ